MKSNPWTAIVLSFSFSLSLKADDSVKPNIVVIMADDLGYGDLSCYGATTFETPHIDRLAREGQQFVQGYCSASTCTPTRYSFLTGTYAFRVPGTGIAPPNGHLIIDSETTTLPDLLKEGGYKTGIVGKWHLGLGIKGKGPDWNGQLTPGPAELGFDHHFLLPTTNDRVPQVYVSDSKVLNLDTEDPLWVGNKKPSPDHPTGKTHRDTLKMDWSHGHNGTIHNGISRIGFYTGGEAARFRDEDLADKWVEQSVKWIEQNKDHPFFLFYASHDLHVPRIPHERFQGVTPHGFRTDSIVQLDWTVGEIIKTLERLELKEKTLVIFCSDNGPVLDDGYKDGAVTKLGKHKPGGIYRDGKYSVYEGGTRTPFISYWPGTIPAGTSDQIISTIDLATTLPSLAGVKIPDDACLDSLVVTDALLGRTPAQGRSEVLQQDNRGGKLGLRIGNWKLTKQASPKKGKGRAKYELFNLTKDPSEQKDLSSENPDELSRLKKRLEQIIEKGRTRPTEG